jgi:hypothetical protein
MRLVHEPHSLCLPGVLRGLPRLVDGRDTIHTGSDGLRGGDPFVAFSASSLAD